MSRGTNSILSEIEWDEGLSMPVANAENKALEDQVKPMLPLLDEWPPPSPCKYHYDFVMYIT